MSQKNNIEIFFKQRFDNYKVNPDGSLWTNLQRKLFWQRFLRFNFSQFNIYYLTTIILGLGFAFFLSQQKIDKSTDNTTNKTVSTKNNSKQNNQFSIDSKNDNSSNQDNKTSIKITSPRIENMKNTIAEDDGKKGNDTSKNNLTGIISEIDYNQTNTKAIDTISKMISTSKLAKINKKNKLYNIASQVHVSQDKGCAPLHVEFSAANTQSNFIKWEMGDGTYSTETNPVKIYKQAGVYVVELKIKNAKNIVETHIIDTIQVFESPKAEAEAHQQHLHHKLNPGLPVVFYNYSKGGKTFEWQFGDNEKSNEKEPIHYYDKTGPFTVVLKAWNEHNCMDSVKIPNVLATNPNEYIIFPNAFTPNMDGPIGGHYSLNDKTNDVFFPIAHGVEEYHLKIYNHKGMLMFESKDINIGWDGYYNNHLSPQDVYIWEAKGTFKSGLEFIKCGDVTLIHK